MTNQMVTYNGINAPQRRTIATTTKRKQEQLEALESAQADYYEPLTVADVLWSIAIYGGFILALVFTGVMIGGVI